MLMFFICNIQPEEIPVKIVVLMWKNVPNLKGYEYLLNLFITCVCNFTGAAPFTQMIALFLLAGTFL